VDQVAAYCVLEGQQLMISLSQQIEEVERELQMRHSVYGRFVGRKRAYADYQMQRMQGVLETLQWLKRNEQRIMSMELDREPWKRE
jgi:hypothetical protein